MLSSVFFVGNVVVGHFLCAALFFSSEITQCDSGYFSGNSANMNMFFHLSDHCCTVEKCVFGYKYN